MPSLVTDNFRVFAAQQFMESLEEPYSDANSNTVADNTDAARAYRSKIYLFTGRSTPWNAERYAAGQPEASGVSELSPPEAYDSFNDMNEIFDDMISAKRITRSDLSQVIRRNTWNPNVKYDMYRNNYTTVNPSINGQTSLYDAQFYVINSNYQVYKCISNGQSPSFPNGRQSTVEPTGTTTSIIESPSDGYRWKYMYTIDIADYIKFVSTDFMPVKKDTTVAAAAIDGSIDQLVITNAGSALTNNTYYCAIVGDGSGAVAQLQVTGNSITSATLHSVGSGYTRGTALLNKVYTDSGLSVGQTSLSTGSIEVVISPPGGHGSDPVVELGGYRVMINKTLDFLDGDGDIPVNSTFRRFGLLADPTDQNGDDLISTTATACLSMRFPTSGSGAPSGDFTPGALITQSTGLTPTHAVGVVIHYDSVTGVLRYYQNEYIDDVARASGDAAFVAERYKSIPFSGSNEVTQTIKDSNGNVVQTVSGTPSGTTTSFGISFTNGYALPEVKKNSGDVIYVENRKAVNRSNDQTEDIKLVIEF
jgi:hypothetical protein|tara:strand:- start:4111 stop:5712 length:1602 start_codon:yes stop_codon:yes gene_type:complete